MNREVYLSKIKVKKEVLFLKDKINIFFEKD